MNREPPSLLWLFFSYRGRIARRSFIFSMLFLLLPQIILIRQMVLNENNADALGRLVLVMAVLLVATLWSLSAVSAKRLHDLGVSGMLSVLAFFPPINWLLFVALAVLPSRQETNQHGPPPFPR